MLGQQHIPGSTLSRHPIRHITYIGSAGQVSVYATRYYLGKNRYKKPIVVSPYVSAMSKTIACPYNPVFKKFLLMQRRSVVGTAAQG